MSTELTERGGNIKLYDANGNIFKRMQCGPGMPVHKPWAAAVDKDNDCIIVSDQGDTDLKILDGNLHLINTLRSLFRRPCGIGILRNGNYIISDTASWRHLTVLTNTGRRVLDFGARTKRDNKMVCPQYLAIDHNGRILVSDCGAHRITAFDQDGNQVMSFGPNPHINLVEEWSPQGIAITPTNNIIVADHTSNKISLYSPSGELIQNVVECDYPPWGLAVHEEGIIAVASDPSVMVYQCENIQRM